MKGKGRSAGGAATQVQVCEETVELSQLLLPAPGGSALLRWSMSMLSVHRCSSWIDGMTFQGVYTGTRPEVPPQVLGPGWL